MNWPPPASFELPLFKNQLEVDGGFLKNSFLFVLTLKT
jgi:hypothetical protein